MVFSSNTIKIEFDTDTTGAAENFVEVIQTIGISKTNDLTVEEWDTYGSIWSEALATGGKKMSFSFESKMDPTNDAHKAIRDVVFTGDINLHNGRVFKLTFPIQNSTNSSPRTETYTGVLKPTADGGQGATEVAVLNYDFMVVGEPAVVEEAA